LRVISPGVGDHNNHRRCASHQLQQMLQLPSFARAITTTTITNNTRQRDGCRSSMSKEGTIMQRLILDDITTITGIDPEALKSQRRRGQIAFAFGCSDASARLRYTAADVVAVMLTKELAQVYGAKLSARLVIMFGDVVLRAIAEAEADTANDTMISVADVERDDRRGHVAYVGRNAAVDAVVGNPATEEKPGVSTDVADDYTIERVVGVNVTRTIRTIRASAAAEHIDLSGAFMPVPGSVEYDAIMSAFGELPGGVVETGAFRKRESAMRKVGEKARLIAMGGAGHRNASGRASEAAAAV
jgi:hypothetical protein